MIEFLDVSKKYGEVTALRGISFAIEPGECVALLGANGAGKTTAIEILLGLRRADSGVVFIDGRPPHALDARRRMAATPQNTGFPDALKVRELVEFAASHYPAPRDAGEVLEAFELDGEAQTRVGSLSGGQQRRVALALAFVANSDVVVLDEPSTGLDVESRRRLWAQLRAGMERRTTLFTTHYMEEAEALATRIVVIDRGEIRFDGSSDAFRRSFGMRRIEYVGEPIAAGDASVERIGGRTIVRTADTDRYIRELVRADVPFHDLKVAENSFEEIFLDLTGAAS